MAVIRLVVRYAKSSGRPRRNGPAARTVLPRSNQVCSPMVWVAGNCGVVFRALAQRPHLRQPAPPNVPTGDSSAYPRAELDKAPKYANGLPAVLPNKNTSLKSRLLSSQLRKTSTCNLNVDTPSIRLPTRGVTAISSPAAVSIRLDSGQSDSGGAVDAQVTTISFRPPQTTR